MDRGINKTQSQREENEYEKKAFKKRRKEKHKEIIEETNTQNKQSEG